MKVSQTGQGEAQAPKEINFAPLLTEISKDKLLPILNSLLKEVTLVGASQAFLKHGVVAKFCTNTGTVSLADQDTEEKKHYEGIM